MPAAASIAPPAVRVRSGDGARVWVRVVAPVSLCEIWSARQGQASVVEMDQVRGSDFLQLDVTAAPGGRLAHWLTGELRTAIGDGRLSVGARLPATRMLADQL